MPAASQPPLPPLARPVASLRGVGPERAAQLARLDIRTVEDLLLHRPRRYEDRRQVRPIADLRLGEAAVVRGKVVAVGVKWFRQHTKSICELILNDGTARLHCRWWNLPYMEKYFAVGDEVWVFGKVLNLKPRTVDHPETEVIEDGEESSIHLRRLTPVYPLTEGLPQRWLRALIWRTLETHESEIAEPWPQAVLRKVSPVTETLSPHPNPLPRGEGNKPGGGTGPTGRADGATAMTRARAIRLLHIPEEPGDPEAARRRLALDEFVDLQRQIQLRRKNFETKARALPCAGDNRLIRPFLAALGYKLTPAQTRVLRELRQDMAGAHPMRRLLQGDVGAGKTAVAACCALMALESGYGVALMAPTEILAEQHYRTFTAWFAPLGTPVHLRTASRKTGEPASESAAGTPELALGQPPPPAALTIGTHALIESGFSPDNLGLVIIDEQHRFGVAQREQLLRKGNYPHLLVMTATPIPRTLGLTLYGELDVSVIDALPPGRGQVKTFVRTADKLPKVWEFLRGQLAEGRQAYIVYPRVEESGAGGVKAVTREFDNVRQALAPFKTGLLHGRLRAREKEDVMRAFRANEVQALLATSLVEVGLDVPNATIMLVENAEQFGLAQLHQLRGRIGRGARDSYCILLAGAKAGPAPERLLALAQNADGFAIAETDLRLRGPGELLGQQQSGLPKFRFGDLAVDGDLVFQARQIASRLVAPPV